MRHDSPHYSLLAAALSGNPRTVGADWDWDQTVQIAAREEILPALHGKLSCPPEVADFLEGIFELNQQRNFQLLREIESLAVLLNRSGIQPVLLKGAAYLVAGVYSDPAGRFLQDIDLLTSPSQSVQAFETIRRSGYEPYVPKPTALGRHHHPMLTQLHRVPVEVHQSLGLGACSTFVTADEMVDASTPLQLGQATVRIPSPEHLTTHLIMHSQMQHGSYDRIWPSLRAMLDLVLLQRRFTIPWEAIRSRFASRRRASLLNLHLMQVEKTMGMKPPYALSPGGIRWQYRRLLWKEPRLRYLDPGYIFPRVFQDKLQVAHRLLKDPASRKFVLLTPFRAGFYKRLFSDIARG